MRFDNSIYMENIAQRKVETDYPLNFNTINRSLENMIIGARASVHRCVNA